MSFYIRAMRLKKRHLFIILLFTLSLVYGTTKLISGISEKSSEVISWPLNNKVIVIDPGHGGKDPGVVEEGIREKDITTEVSIRLSTILGQAGAIVFLTRDSDESLANTKREDLDERISIANNRDADLFISIHVNSYRAGRGVHGAQTFSQPGNKASKVLAEYIQDELVRVLGNNHRKAKQVDYYLLRNASMPAVIVEVGFITNSIEGELLQNPAYQSKVAYAIFTGIVNYLNEHPVEMESQQNDIEPLEVFSETPYHLETP